MRLLRTGRYRIMIAQVMWIIITWTMLGMLDALNTQALALGENIQMTKNFDFWRYFWVNTFTAFVAGLISGPILIFFLRERFRHKSFGVALLVNSFVISMFNFVISVLAFDFFLSFRTGKGPLDPFVLEETLALIRSSFYVKNLIFWSFIAILTIITLHVNEKYGPGVLAKLLLGRYHNPREEERIFMFVDIKSSTTIAERLGHIRFFNLLNDFFRDITNSIVFTWGEVYQYVGDEVVISWTMEKGTKNANCIRCFYNMQEAIQKKSDRYQERYGLIPEFKAGLHCGVVTTGEIGIIKKDIVFSGDVMNTTSRIQSVCNRYGVKVLLSKYLLDKLNLPPHGYRPHRVGMIELKGKRQKVELYTFEEFTRAKELRPLIAST